MTDRNKGTDALIKRKNIGRRKPDACIEGHSTAMIASGQHYERVAHIKIDSLKKIDSIDVDYFLCFVRSLSIERRHLMRSVLNVKEWDKR